MYIGKYWYNYIGGTDDSLTLADYLYDKGREELPLAEIFADTGLDKLNGNFHTSPGLGYTDSEGMEHAFYYAIDLVTDLAALILESRRSGGFNLKDLFDGEERDRFVRITTTPEEDQALDRALADFFADPLSYDLHEMVDDEDMMALARDCEAVRKELKGEAVDGESPLNDGRKTAADLLEQCRTWNEKGKYQKIIDALEAVPAGERTPEMDSELARACNNQAGPEDKELFRKAIALLKPHEAYFQGDHCWNFRMGYAYYYLDQEGPALRYFEQALEARPGDEDTQTLIEDCRKRLALPRFRENFRERTARAWEAFAAREAELRRIMDGDRQHERGDEIIAKCSEALEPALSGPAFELGFNGMKYELILTPEGNKVKLFELVYFQRHAPREVLEHWDVLVGCRPMERIGLRSGDWEISGDDVRVWVERPDENSVELALYCEKLLPLLREDENRAWWMLSTLTDQVLGEVASMALIHGFDVVDAPKEGEAVLLSQLPETVKGLGLSVSNDAGNYLENSYIGYRMEPNEDPEADWRLDIIAGSTNCPVLVSGYLNGESGYMDDLHADGAAAGFLCYPLDGFEGEDRSKKIFAFRDQLEAALAEHTEALTLTGGATGVYCGYIDFIAWDLPAVLDAARLFFEDSGLHWANFHVFRRDAATVSLVSQAEP